MKNCHDIITFFSKIWHYVTFFSIFDVMKQFKHCRPIRYQGKTVYIPWNLWFQINNLQRVPVPDGQDPDQENDITLLN